jgi:hypothetical protein
MYFNFANWPRTNNQVISLKVQYNPKLFEGFSDLEILEKCSEKKRRKSIFRNFEWTTEIYGFGKIYRHYAFWPKLMPIPLSGSHGITLTNRLQPTEIKSKSRYFLTFSKLIFQNKLNNEKRIILVKHPYLNIKPEPLESNLLQGTLVFIPHTIDSVERDSYNFDKYIARLKETFPGPIVLCLQIHDVKNGFLHQMRKYNIPIITLGDSLNYDYAKDFIETILHFKVLTSTNLGSQVLLSKYFGCDYVIFGDKMKFKSNNIEFLNEMEAEQLYKLENNFALNNQLMENELGELYRKFLGSDAPLKRFTLLCVFVNEFIHFFPLIIKDSIWDLATYSKLQLRKIFL